MAPRYNPDPVKAPKLQPQSPGSYPVDPYNRPPQESNISRLASALGDLAPTLQRIAGQAMEGEKNSAEKKAYADFLDMEKTGKAIKDGDLDPAGSPYFQRYYHEKLGALAASRYSQDLTVASAEALSQSTDPAEFDGFAADFRQSWLKDNATGTNGDFMAGFNQSASELEIHARNSFANDASNRLQTNAIKALYAGHQVGWTEIIKNHNGLLDEGAIEEMANFAKKANQHQYFLNPRSGRQISTTTIQAVFDLARTQQDTRLLEILKHIDSAIPGASLWNTQEVQSKITEVTNQIHSDIKKDDAFAQLSHKHEKQTAIDNAINGVWNALDAASAAGQLVQNVDLKPFMDSLTGIAPEQKERLQRIQSAYVQRDDNETTAQSGPLFERAYRGTLTMEQVADAFAERQISKNTANQLRSQIAATKAGKGSKWMIQDQRYVKAEAALLRLYGNNMGPYFNPQTQALSQVAAWQLQRDWVHFLSTNPEAGAEQAGEVWLQQRSGELFSNDMKVPITDRPDAGTIVSNYTQSLGEGAVLTDWKKSRITTGAFLGRIIAENEASKRSGHNELSEPVKSFLSAYRLNKLADIDAFVQAQSKLPERN